MTAWRPKRTLEERTARAVQSMQPGTLQGRVGSARPVKQYNTDLDDPDDDDEVGEDTPGEGGGTDETGGNLLPFTDYYTVKSSGRQSFQLTYLPYLSDYRTVHLYWNDVFQPDSSWQLIEDYVIVDDETIDLKSGDVLTVKYWYNEEALHGSGGITGNLFFMECWMESYTHTEGYGPRITSGGAITGFNGGSIGITSLRHTDASFYGGVNFKFRKKTSDPKIPTTGNVTWYLNWLPTKMGARTTLFWPPSTGTTMNYSGYVGEPYDDHPVGDFWGYDSGEGPNKLFCGWDWFDDPGDILPTDETGFSEGDLNPSTGDSFGVKIPLTNAQGQALAAWLNNDDPSDHYDTRIAFTTAIDAPSPGSEEGCIGGVYGWYVWYNAIFPNMTLGITCVAN